MCLSHYFSVAGSFGLRILLTMAFVVGIGVGVGIHVGAEYARAAEPGSFADRLGIVCGSFRSCLGAFGGRFGIVRGRSVVRL